MFAAEEHFVISINLVFPQHSFNDSLSLNIQSEPTTIRFHMRAASATNVDTELQPGIKTIFMGSVYRRSYSSFVASPGSH